MEGLAFNGGVWGQGYKPQISIQQSAGGVVFIFLELGSGPSQFQDWTSKDNYIAVNCWALASDEDVSAFQCLSLH